MHKLCIQASTVLDVSYSFYIQWMTIIASNSVSWLVGSQMTCQTERMLFKPEIADVIFMVWPIAFYSTGTWI